MEPTTKITKETVLTVRDETGKVVAIVLKDGPIVEFYVSSLASFDEIEEILRALQNK